MKRAIAALALLFTVSAHASDVFVYENYDGHTQKYTARRQSTLDQPISAKWMMRPGVAACYRGNPDEALAILQAMVDMYNFDETVKKGYATAPLSLSNLEVFFDNTLHDDALRIELSLNGRRTPYSWPRIRRCTI